MSYLRNKRNRLCSHWKHVKRRADAIYAYAHVNETNELKLIITFRWLACVASAVFISSCKDESRQTYKLTRVAFSNWKERKKKEWMISDQLCSPEKCVRGGKMPWDVINSLFAEWIVASAVGQFKSIEGVCIVMEAKKQKYKCMWMSIVEEEEEKKVLLLVPVLLLPGEVASKSEYE